ncbi:MAG: hypothetical protein JNM43_28255 [Planctomycetaceae bacterium]|nr:hypothetical protein [Planctomycetaceae bacterium]
MAQSDGDNQPEEPQDGQRESRPSDADRPKRSLNNRTNEPGSDPDLDRPKRNIEKASSPPHVTASGMARSTVGLLLVGLTAGGASWLGNRYSQPSTPNLSSQPSPMVTQPAVTPPPVAQPGATPTEPRSFLAAEVESQLQKLTELAEAERQPHLSLIFRSFPGITLSQLQQVAKAVEGLRAEGKVNAEILRRLGRIQRLNATIANPLSTPLEASPGSSSPEDTPMELAIDALANALAELARANGIIASVSANSTAKDLEDAHVQARAAYSRADESAKKANIYLIEARQQLGSGTAELFSEMLDRSLSTQSAAQQQIAQFATLVSDRRFQEAEVQRKQVEEELEAARTAAAELLAQQRQQIELARQSIQSAFSEFRLAERLERLKPTEAMDRQVPTVQDWEGARALVDSMQPLTTVLGTATNPGSLGDAALPQAARDIESLQLRVVSWESARVQSGQILVVEDGESAVKRFSEIVTEKLKGIGPLMSEGFDKLAMAIKELTVTLPESQVKELEDRAATEAQRRIEKRFSEIPPVPERWGVPRNSARYYFSAGVILLRSCPVTNAEQMASYFGLAAQLQPRDPVLRYHLAIALRYLGQLEEADLQIKAGAILEKETDSSQETTIRLEHVQGEIRMWLEAQKLNVFFPFVIRGTVSAPRS